MFIMRYPRTKHCFKTIYSIGNYTINPQKKQVFSISDPNIYAHRFSSGYRCSCAAHNPPQKRSKTTIRTAQQQFHRGGRCGHRPLREAFSAPCPMSVPPQTAIQPADYVQPHNEHYVVTTATANAPADEGVALC